MKTYLFTLISFFILTSNIGIQSQEEHSTGEKAKESITVFNSDLESLSIYLKEKDKTKACHKSIQITKHIEKDIQNLRFIEPNYDWDEIRAVLFELPSEYCPNLNNTNKDIYN